MKSFIRRFVMVAIVLCSSAISPQVYASDEDAVRSLMQQWLSAYNSKDINALMSLYSDKIYYANNGNMLVQNTQTIKRNYTNQFESGSKATIDFSEELVTAGETLAHIAGKYRVNIPQAGGAMRHAYGRVLLIFEKQDMQWKLIVDFDNTGTDITADNFNN